MTKKYEVVLFTDMSTRIYPARPLGAYRLATELRKNNISVLVINFFSKWIQNSKDYDNLLKSCISENTCAVGFSSTFFSLDNDYKNKITSWQDYFGGELTPWPSENKIKISLLISRIKKLNKDVKIFYGGAQADNLSDYLKDVGIDYVVQGLADGSFIDSIIRIKNNKQPKFNLKQNFKVVDYDPLALSFHFPSSNIKYEKNDFIRRGEVLSLETSRGCLFHCAFCAFPLLGRNKNHPEYHKNLDTISQEISDNYKNWGVRKYMLVDDTFNESTQKLKLIFDAIKKSKIDIEFSAYLRLDLLERFPEQVQLLKDMGLKSAFLGIETLNEQAGKSIGKNSYKVIDELEKIKSVWKDDIVVHGNFIAGLPYENSDSINQWMEWIFNKDYLIQNYYLGALAINSNSSFKSKICKNPEKYDYTFDSEGNWINNIGYTESQAKFITDYWMKKGWESGRLRLAGWDMLGLQNLGYKFDDLKKYSLKDLDFDSMQIKYSEFVDNYKKDLMAYLKST